jgi:predicted carbohydrate-binding protein with CBM5 and CBM33 domain
LPTIWRREAAGNGFYGCRDQKYTGQGILKDPPKTWGISPVFDDTPHKMANSAAAPASIRELD